MGTGSIQQAIDAELTAVSHAPVLFILAIVLAGVVIWRIVKALYGNQIESLRGTIENKEAQFQLAQQERNIAKDQLAGLYEQLQQEKGNPDAQAAVLSHSPKSVVEMVRTLAQRGELTFKLMPEDESKWPKTLHLTDADFTSTANVRSLQAIGLATASAKVAPDTYRVTLTATTPLALRIFEERLKKERDKKD